MQSHLARAMRFGAVALGSVTLMGVATDAASATSVRYGSTTVLPASGSSLVPNAGTNAIKATGLSGNATFSAPGGSGTCTTGSVTSGLAGNAAGSGSVTLPGATLAVSGCTDNNSAYDLVSITLKSYSSASVVYNASGTNAFTITNPVFGVNIRTVSSGLVTSCNATPNTGTTVTGSAINGTTAGSPPSTLPRLAFSNVNVKTASGGPGPCTTNIGTGGSAPANSSLFSVTFQPLLDSSNRYVGVFA